MEIKRLSKAYVILTLVVLMLGLEIFYFVVAEPGNVDSINVSDSDRRTLFGGATERTIDAFAGNVTELTLNTSKRSNRWQGYYGNISGTITLDDARNFTLYSWAGDISPSGEIYAADTPVSNWSGVYCFNMTDNRSGNNCTGAGSGGGSGGPDNITCLNISEAQQKFGGPLTGEESLNATFTSTHDIEIDGTVFSNCPATQLYTVNESQTINWTEVLLTENNTRTLIFASIINASTNGFNNVSQDFQMIVGHDGDNSTLTTYTLYVELT